jgi:hypothetical protein
MEKNIAKAMECTRLMNLSTALWTHTKSQTTATKYTISKTGLCNGKPVHPTEPLLHSEAKAIDLHYEEVRFAIEEALAAGL